MKKILLSLIGFVAFVTSNFAQQTDIPIENWCGTSYIMNEVRSNAAYSQMLLDQEILNQQELLNGDVAPKGTVYKIPIVFHILHNGGSENISEEQIFNALEVINRDFRLQNADTVDVLPMFKPLLRDAEIEFVLATKAPNGDCFKGYTRTQSSTTFSGGSGWPVNPGGDQLQAIIDGNDVYNGEWPGNKYLNVFVVADCGGAGGYTTNPGVPYGSTMYNGIWILNTQFGEIGTSSVTAGRSLTHEIGHWFNLEHTWGNSNSPGDPGNCSTDDNVTDTPNCIGGTVGCNLGDNGCGPIANAQNYMDYYLSCQSMFTDGQVTRMRSAATSSSGGRNNLWKTANLTATGATGVFSLCKTDFSANRTSVCAGEQIQFTDESFNAVTGWTWNFTGGSPAMSTSQNPVVTYNSPGLYEVSLSATDGTNTQVETKTAYIRVLPPASNIPLLEGFENYSSLVNIEEWEVTNENGVAWELGSSGLSSSKSAQLLNFGEVTGTVDALISAPVDLSGVTGSMTLSFRYAYKRKNAADNDYFRVRATSDCGDAWAIRKTLHANQISSEVQATSFTPSSIDDWTTVHMTNITNTYWTDQFRYLFEFEAGGGNNMYLDNINIYEGTPSDNLVIGIGENDGFENLSVYPNPAEDELNVRFSVNGEQTALLEVQEVSGKINQAYIVQANQGSNVVLIDTKKLSSGMYFLRVNVGGRQNVVQFVVK